MIVKSMPLRLLVGSFSILMGLVLLKIYFGRGKEGLWADLYKMSLEMSKIGEGNVLYEKMFLVLGGLAICAGLIAIFYGFRSKMVGY
jgi:hypothetical protein